MSIDMLDSLAFGDDYILPEGIWNKFELDTDLSMPFSPSIYPLSDDLSCLDDCLIQHDCMWTGLCGSKEHNMDESRTPVMSGPSGDNKAPAVASPTIKQVVPVTSQQSLLKPGLRMGAVNPHVIVPMTTSLVSVNPVVPKVEPESLQTPPMSDDEESKPTKTMKILHDAIFDNLESIIEDDGDLSDYFKNADEEEFGLLDDEFEEEDEEEEEEEDEDEEEDVKPELDDDGDVVCDDKANKSRNNRPFFKDFFNAESDHNYHKGTVMMQPANLGLETPSDSEEEIDVVSLGDKLNNACNNNTHNVNNNNVKLVGGGALPTNPSSKDRHQLQRTMQSRFPQGIKTLLPTRSSTYRTAANAAAAAAAPPVPKRAAPSPSARTPRRPRQYKKYTNQQRHYNKRRSNYSSDSEVEPSEKRNLHNNMERQRRIDLRNLFEDLKVLVPEVNKKQRAAKVLILRGAAQYCRGLTTTSNSLTKQVDDLRKQQERLRARLSYMRRNLAANR